MTRSPDLQLAALAMVLVVSACAAQATATPQGSGPVEHPTAANVVVLRLEEGGGLVPMDFFATQLPTFSLYGDGTVLYAQEVRHELEGATGPLPLRKATMDDAQMSALLAFALGQGGLADARADYPNPQVADGPSSIFAIRADAVDKTVGVYALGIESPDTPDLAIRARFQQLAIILRAFAGQVAAGRATDAGIYQPPAYRAVLAEEQGVPAEVRDWPWDDLAPEDFARRPSDPVFATRRYAVITPEQARTLSQTPEGGLYAIAVLGPDRVPYTIAVRPLLPDETE